MGSWVVILVGCWVVIETLTGKVCTHCQGVISCLGGG